MNISTFQYDFSDLKLDIAHIEKVIGYKEGESQETISALIHEMLIEVEEISRIKAEYRIYNCIKFNEAGKSVEINNVQFQINKIIYRQIKKASSIAIFLCTAGAETGIRSRKAMRDGDLLTGYIIDVIGSEIVEAAADLMQAKLQEEMNASGLKITNRFSPGYCGWNVDEQQKLFRLMPDNFCGIRLNDSSLMDPEKSVSGFIGIGTDVKKLPYTCHLCDMKDCIYRRIKT
jgi:hypothetical protein